MGLYDRDYLRDDRPGSAGPHRARVGRMRPWSFNTWLIVVNIVVFLLGVLVLHGGKLSRPVETGYRIVLPDATPAMVERAVVDRSRIYPLQLGVLGTYEGYAEIDPQTRRVVGLRRVEMRPLLEAWGHFSTARGFFGLEVWRFVTFQFLHANLTHLAFNLVGLWFVGGIVEQYLGRKRYAAFYLTCGIFGAVMYLGLNFLGAMLNPVVGQVPGLLFDNIYTPLVGASAGIFGVLMAAAYIDPKAEVMVLFAIPMRMRTAVYLFTAIALFNLLSNSANAGGEAAHIGGAIAGYFFIRRMHLLRDFFDVLGNSSAGTPPAAPPSKRGGPVQPPPPRVDQAVVDALLAKIAASGVDSLTKQERQTLTAATEARRRG